MPSIFFENKHTWNASAVNREKKHLMTRTWGYNTIQLEAIKKACPKRDGPRHIWSGALVDASDTHHCRASRKMRQGTLSLDIYNEENPKQYPNSNPRGCVERTQSMAEGQDTPGGVHLSIVWDRGRELRPCGSMNAASYRAMEATA